jgi:hypothetical protein
VATVGDIYQGLTDSPIFFIGQNGDDTFRAPVLGPDDLIDGGWGRDNLYGGDDLIAGGDDEDELFGDGEDDTLIGGDSNDFIDGGTGTNTAVFGGNHLGYATGVTLVGERFVADLDRSDGYDGTDTLKNIQNLKFEGDGWEGSLSKYIYEMTAGPGEAPDPDPEPDPDPPPSDYYGQSMATAALISTGQWVNGSIETAGDQDWFAINLIAGWTYSILLGGSSSDGDRLDDPYLNLMTARGLRALTTMMAAAV